MRTVGILAAIAVVFVGAWLLLPWGTARAPENITEPNTLQLMAFSLTSSVFQNNESIPSKYTCDAENVSPALMISGVPAGAKSLALIMHDPDAPREGGFTHWVRFNIPPQTTEISEATEPEGIAGAGGSGKGGYVGPCPPSGEHRYFFYLYALNAELTLPVGATKAEVEAAMQGHILAGTELIGRYSKIAK